MKLFLFFLLISPEVLAHSVDSDDIYASLYRSIIENSENINIVEEPQPRKFSSYVKVGGKYMEINSFTWDLVRSWVRVYKKEIEASSMVCNASMSPYAAGVRSAQADQSFFKRKIWGPMLQGSRHILQETVSIGSVLGKAAFVAKVTSEIAETVVSKMVGGAGVHVLCNVIDAALIFGYRYFQVTYRAPLFLHKTGDWNQLRLLKMYFISRAIRKAQGKVRLVISPAELDTEKLQQLDEQGSRRWFGWVKKGKRSKFLERLVRKGEAVLNRKKVLGSRYKRFLWLKTRKWGHKGHIWGKSSFENVSKSSWVWVLAVEEELVRPGLTLDGSVATLPEGARKPRIQEVNRNEVLGKIQDPLVLSIIEGGPQNSFRIALIKDLASIIHSKSSKEAYLYLSLLEASLVSNIRGAFEKTLHSKLEENAYPLWLDLKIRWYIGVYTRYIYELFDFLRVVVMQPRGPQQSWYFYNVISGLDSWIYEIQRPWVEVLEGDHLVALEKLRESSSQLLSEKPWEPKARFIKRPQVFAPKCLSYFQSGGG